MKHKPIENRSVRVGVYGTGNFANQQHLPNLSKLEKVDLVAAADINKDALNRAAEKFDITRSYEDPHEMLEKEELDILYSIVPAFVRTDVEATAAAKGIHLFSEKPQALNMEVARRIADAVDEGSVFSSVCFRERYRPIFREAKRLLAGKNVIHIRFQSWRGVSPKKEEIGKEWSNNVDLGGSAAFDWGVHAVDYSRYMSGHDIVGAQGFVHHPQEFALPLSTSYNFVLDSGATLHLSFVSAGNNPTHQPYFLIFYEGGYLGVHGYDFIEMNGERVYTAEEYNPWFELDRRFIEAVRKGDDSDLLNDYRDGLLSLGPVLAAWESTRRKGEMIDVVKFIDS